ncbi:MAG: MATE family efflux transporter [Christensenellales bacterium]|jgi:putative MATE family efflux protein
MQENILKGGTGRTENNGPLLFSNAALRALIIPLIIEQILAITIGMADTMMVSYVGEAAVSGVSLVDSINVVLIQVFSAMAIGGSIVASQYLGKDDPVNARGAARQLIYSSTGIALIITALAMPFSSQILGAIYGNIEADVMENAQKYFALSVASYPFLALTNAGTSIYRVVGKSRITMYVSVVMNVVHIIGNVIAIYMLDWGAMGAGVSTLITRITGAAIVVLLLRRPGQVMFMDKLYRVKLEFKMIKQLMRMGIPNALENSLFHVGRLIISTLVSSLGTTAIAANAVCSQVSNMVNVVGNGIGAGILTVISRCVGAGDYRQTKYYVKKLVLLAYAAAVVMDILMLAFNKQIISLYGLSHEGRAMAQEIIIYILIANVLFWVPSFPFANVLRGAGDVKYTMYVSFISMFAFRVGLCYFFVLSMDLGLLGVYLGMIADWAFRGIFFAARYFSGKWMGKKVID